MRFAYFMLYLYPTEYSIKFGIKSAQFSYNVCQWCVWCPCQSGHYKNVLSLQYMLANPYIVTFNVVLIKGNPENEWQNKKKLFFKFKYLNT